MNAKELLTIQNSNKTNRSNNNFTQNKFNSNKNSNEFFFC